MKKVLAILLPILIIIAAIVLLYMFVLIDIVDPPPEKVVEKAIEAAQEYINNDNENTRLAFVERFSDGSRAGLEREWNALNLEGYPRGSWYELAVGMLNTDGTLPEMIGPVQAAEGEEEEEAEEEGEETTAVVRIKVDRVERDIPMIREDGEWRINIPVHPQPLVAQPEG